MLGVEVSEVSPGGAGAQAGVLVGDWIVAFNGVPVSSSARLLYEKDRCAVGDAARITVLREGQRLELQCVLGAMPESLE